MSLQVLHQNKKEFYSIQFQPTKNNTTLLSVIIIMVQLSTYMMVVQFQPIIQYTLQCYPLRT